MNHARLRRILIGIWLVVVAAALYLFIFHRDRIQQEIQDATALSMFAGGAFYLFFGSIRGFTLMPATTLVVAAIPFFRPVPLFALTLTGILISSASIYWFSEALHLEELLAEQHRARMTQLESALRRYELPVIIAWSFFPLAPTDLICYVCGVLRIDVRKCLLGVGIGEGVICAIYIFLGDQALRALHLRF
ncbi:MAG: VTT domain-containing protein [Vicinamibacterales bacterium]